MVDLITYQFKGKIICLLGPLITYQFEGKIICVRGRVNNDNLENQVHVVSPGFIYRLSIDAEITYCMFSKIYIAKVVVFFR